MSLKVEVDPDEVMSKNADSKGRVLLGTDYADMDNLTIIVSTDD